MNEKENSIAQTLKALSCKYENKEFLIDDPSKFMHEVSGKLNQETMAFIASTLSYGSRKQFFPKIQFILNKSNGDVYNWILKEKFIDDIPDNDKCYYRLYTNHTMIAFFHALKNLFIDFQSLGKYIELNADDGFTAIKALVSYFSSKNIEVIIPKNTNSSCKRLCMFLRWMVRDNSPVDLGLWSQPIDKCTLIMPMDTHVLTEAIGLGFLNNRTASMNSAKKLTEEMKHIFPDDPLKGDFALFGYGVNKK